MLPRSSIVSFQAHASLVCHELFVHDCRFTSSLPPAISSLPKSSFENHEAMDTVYLTEGLGGVSIVLKSSLISRKNYISTTQFFPKGNYYDREKHKTALLFFVKNCVPYTPCINENLCTPTCIQNFPL